MMAFRSLARRAKRTLSWGAACGLLLTTVACGSAPTDTTSASAPTTNNQPVATTPTGTTTTPAAGTETPIAPDTDLVRHETPKKRVVLPADLPAPYESRSANNPSRVVERPEGAKLTVPPGFTIEEWMTGLDNPRIITTAPNGDIFVAESGPSRIHVIRPKADGTKAQDAVFVDGLKQPFGIAFYPAGPNPTHIYIANTDSIVRFPYHNGDLKATGGAETIIADLPGGGYHQHWTRDIVFSPDGKKLYFSVGSRSNVGEEPLPRASISECNPDGSGRRTYASGIRNPVGLAFNPVTKALWTSVNERDELGDNLVPDYATSVKDGGFYGWPYYYIGQNHDPRMPEKPELKARVMVPDVLFQAHVASLAMTFYTGKAFPATYHNSAFAAHHGSWNRTQRSGYEIVRIPMNANGTPAGGYEPFVSGWVLPDGRVWGRPVGVTTAKDGSLLITDDGGNKIWRVRYLGNAQTTAQN